MPIPLLKKINLLSTEAKAVKDQLGQTQFDQFPHLINISSLGEQFTALNSIEEYLKQQQIFPFPYPIYVLGQLDASSAYVEIIQDENEIPSFFLQKHKVPNVKETNMLNKIALKQTNIKTLMHTEDKDGIEAHALGHRKLFFLVKKGLFFERVLTALKNRPHKEVDQQEG